MRPRVRWAACGLVLVAAVCAAWLLMELRLERAVRVTRDEMRVNTARDPQAALHPGNGLAFARASGLQRGINLSGWYSLKPNYSSPQLGRHMTPDSMRRLKQLGFDHVRLCIDPEPLFTDGQGGTLRPKALATLDSTLRDLSAAGLNVVLDVHPEQSWKVSLAQGYVGVDNFLAFWTAFATHFAATDPDHVFFEVMNEPTMEDSYRWQGIQAEVIERIRSVAPGHTLIATATPYSNLDGLLKIEPVRDNNIIYTFHEYDPRLFTHQGATWAGDDLIGLHDIPYPATPENIQGILSQMPDQTEKLLVERFAWDRWDAARIAMEIAAVDRWATAHGVPLYCGEFGVYKEYADPKARARWISDVRTALESRRIGWAMWDYDGNFGLFSKNNGKEDVDADVLHALGLKN